MTDRELLQRFIQDKSQDAFATLVERYAGLVYGTCLRVLNESHAAEDAAQATFIAFAQKASTFNEKVVLAGWLHRAALLSARDVQKATQRRQIREKEASAMPRNDGHSESDWSALQPEIDAALAALPTEQRDTIVLRYLHGLSHAQLAAEFACPPETIHTRLNRGLRTLREILERRRVYVSLALLALLLETNAHATAPGATILGIQQACAAHASSVAATTSGSGLIDLILRHKILTGAVSSAALIALGLAFFPLSTPQPVASQVVPSQPVPITTPPNGRPRPAIAGTSKATSTNTQAPAKIEANDPEKALNSSLQWLARIQEPDGHYDGKKYGALESQDVAVTSLALLAYLGAGHTAKQGEYQSNVDRAVNWLKANPSDEITQASLRLLSLAEHAGMTNTDQLFVQMELNALVARQETAGLWLEPNAKHLYEKVIEPTTWSAFALKSAQVSGMNVPMESLLRTRSFLRLQSERVLQTAGPQDILSRASLYNARRFLGDKTDLEGLTAELLDYKPAFHPEGLSTEIIAWYQGSLAAFNSGTQWEEWSTAMRRELLSNQVLQGEFTGSWNVRQSSEKFKWGRIGASAMSALNLEIYYRFAALQKAKARAIPAKAPAEEPRAEGVEF